MKNVWGNVKSVFLEKEIWDLTVKHRSHHFYLRGWSSLPTKNFRQKPSWQISSSSGTFKWIWAEVWDVMSVWLLCLYYAWLFLKLTSLLKTEIQHNSEQGEEQGSLRRGWLLCFTTISMNSTSEQILTHTIYFKLKCCLSWVSEWECDLVCEWGICSILLLFFKYIYFD